MIPGPKHRRLLTVGAETLARSIRGAERRGGGAWGGVSPPHGKGWGESQSDSRRRPEGLTACGKTHTAFDRRSIPAEPRRFAPLIVAFRSKYTRASSPGGGSSLTRLVSRTPTGRTGRARRSPGFHHRLLAPRIRRMQGAGVLFRRVARCRVLAPRGDSLPARTQCRDLAARSAAGEGCGEGFPLPTGKGGENREAILDAAPRG